MKHAAYCGTRAIYEDMEMSAKSLIANSDVDFVHFIIEDGEFPKPLPDMVVCHDASGQEFFPEDGPNMDSRYTYMAMMRIALCRVLPDADIVLSLDSDLVAKRDVSELWYMPISDCYFSAVPEWHRTGNGMQYCNFGVVLYNLEKMRDGKADECIEVLNRRRFSWVEQDVGNYLCQGRIHEMPATYNQNWWTDKNGTLNPHIVHYAGVERARWTVEYDALKWRATDWDEALRLHEAVRHG